MIIKGDYGDHPAYVNVEYNSGKLYNYWIDSLSASFAGLQVNTLYTCIEIHMYNYKVNDN